MDASGSFKDGLNGSLFVTDEVGPTGERCIGVAIRHGIEETSEPVLFTAPCALEVLAVFANHTRRLFP